MYDNLKVFKSKNEGSNVEEYKHQNKVALIGVALCAVMVLLAGMFGKKHFEPADFVSFEYFGADGYASAKCIVDSERIYKTFAGNEKNMEKLTAYRNLADSMKATVAETDIANGDKMTVTVEYDAELAEKIGITVSKSVYTVRASGISEGEETDLFANVEVIFAGISPNAYVVINNKWEDEYLSKLEFSADKTSDVTIGDEITVTCSASVEDLARNGIVAKQLSVVYKADRLSSYVTKVEQIDMEMLQSMQNEAQKTIHSQTEDKTFRMLYRATGNDDYLYALNEETTSNIQLVDKLFLTRKNVSEADTGNYVYLIYSAEVSNQDSMELVYFAFEYLEGYVTVDGVFNILHDEPAGRYSCSTDYEALYQEKIGAKEALYNIVVIE